MNTNRAAATFIKAMLFLIIGCVVFLDVQGAEVKPVAEGASQPERVISKTECKAVPEGQFPTGAIVQNMNDGARFTSNPSEVSVAFDLSVGVLTVDEVPFHLHRLCK